MVNGYDTDTVTVLKFEKISDNLKKFISIYLLSSCLNEKS